MKVWVVTDYYDGIDCIRCIVDSEEKAKMECKDPAHQGYEEYEVE